MRHTKFVQKNCNKAMAIALAWCHALAVNKDFSHSSGTCFNDLYKHILVKMKTLLNSEGCVEDKSNREQDDDNKVKESS